MGWREQRKAEEGKAEEADHFTPDKPSPEKPPLSIFKRLFGIVPFVSGFVVIGSLAYKTYQDGKVGPIRGYVFFGILSLALISWGAHWMLGLRIPSDEEAEDHGPRPTPARKPTLKPQPKPPRREPARRPPPTREVDPDEPGGALKPLLITFGAVLLAFGGIMAVVLATAPTAGDVAVAPGDPNPPAIKPSDPQPVVTPPKPTGPTGPIVPPVVPPVTPVPGDVAAIQLAMLPATANTINGFQYSDKHDLLFYHDTTSITVLDAKAGTPLPLPKVEGKGRLRSVGVAPDQTAAFASDGQTLHRLDLATRKWESRPFTGTRVLALDGTTVLVLVKALSPVTWAVVRWDAGEAKELRRMTWDRLYELGYDPVAKALFALHTKAGGAAGAVLERYARTGDEFKSEGSKKITGGGARVVIHPLTADGKYFFQSSRAVPTDLKTNTSAEFNEAVTGSVGEWAVGKSGKLFSVATGKLAGKMATPADAVAAASDGRTIWVQARDIGKFVKYQIEAGKK